MAPPAPPSPPSKPPASRAQCTRRKRGFWQSATAVASPGLLALDLAGVVPQRTLPTTSVATYTRRTRAHLSSHTLPSQAVPILARDRAKRCGQRLVQARAVACGHRVAAKERRG